MKKIWLLLTLFLVMFGLLFVVKNDAFALGKKSCNPPCSDDEKCNFNGDCVAKCEPPCGAGEKCSWNGNCVPAGGNNPTDIPQPTATSIPTATPVPPTATPVPPTATPAPGCTKKIQGDADCDGSITLKDYFYYVAKKSGAALPATVNVDFDASGTVDDADRKIVVKTLKP